MSEERTVYVVMESDRGLGPMVVAVLSCPKKAYKLYDSGRFYIEEHTLDEGDKK